MPNKDNSPRALNADLGFPELAAFYADLLSQAGGAWFDFEAIIKDLYLALLVPGDVVVDAGANQGDHTFQMAQAVAPGGKVIAIEAVPELAENLLRTLSKHYSRFKKVVDVRGVGLSDHQGVAAFYYAPEQSGLSGLQNRTILSEYLVQEIKVHLAPLDEVCRGIHGRVRFIKIDIEGAEYQALRGGLTTISHHRPVIVFEHNWESPSDFGYRIEELLDLFHSLGYHIYDLFGNSYDTPELWELKSMWNFVALPDSADRDVVFGATLSSLAKIGISLEGWFEPQLSKTNLSASVANVRDRQKQHMSNTSIPFPPLAFRQLVSPIVDDSYYDNPSGDYIWGPLDIGPLRPGQAYGRVFDFGCGCGREARRLLLQREKPELYVGVDINRRMIEWCQKNLQDKDFSFHHHDVWNVNYAPENSRHRCLPITQFGSGFTLIEADSVFTHLHDDQTQFYLRQMRSMLGPNGVIRATWFLFNKRCFPMMADNQNTVFVNEVDTSQAVYYDWQYFVTLTRSVGYRIAKIDWAQMLGFHNIIYLTPSADFVDLSDSVPPGTSVIGY